MSQVKLSDYDVITQALVALAARCDHAQSQDGAGFNKPDASLGKFHADFINRGGYLTEGEQLKAIQMLQKYRGQLMALGIDLPTPDVYSTLPVPAFARRTAPAPITSAPAPSVSPGILIDAAQNELIISFPYDADLVSKIKALPYALRKYDPVRKAWRVAPALYSTLVAIASGAQITPAAQALDTGVPAPALVAPAPFTISLKDDALCVAFEYDPLLVASVKALPERTFDKASKTWIVPLRLVSDLVKLFPQALLAPEVSELIERSDKRLPGPPVVIEAFDVPLLTGELMPFQREGTFFLEEHDGCALIGDDMGLGKTLQSLAYLQNHPELRPAVIVCPASVKLNWENEVLKFMIDAKRTHVIRGKKTYALPASDVYLINYDILGEWVDRLVKIKPQVVVYDEIHRVKDRTTKRAKASKALAKTIPHRIGLTGTPILNGRNREIWQPLNIIAPDVWPKYHPFAVKYCGGHMGRFGFEDDGATNNVELHQQLKSVMIRRKKEAVLKDLPDRRSVRIDIEMTPAFRLEYEAALEEARLKIEKDGTGEEALALIEKAKQITLAAKLPAVMEWIEDFIGDDQKLVVFAAHRSATEALYDEFKDQAVKIIGGMSDIARQAAKESFQDDPNIKLFVGNHQAAGEGITLTAARSLAFIEFCWQPGLYRQCRDRIHRISQKNACTIYNFVCVDTIDETILKLLERKAELTDKVIDGQYTADLGGSVADEIMDMLIG